MWSGRRTGGCISQGDYTFREWPDKLSLTEDAFTRSSNKMPVAVKAAIKNAAAKVGNMSDEEATDLLCSMERSGRLIEETWN